MLRRSVFAALALVAAASSMMAAETTIGDVSINLPPPAGFCELTDREPADRRMIIAITELVAKSGNKLLIMSADCEQLADWRASKRQLLDDFVQYQTPVRVPDTSLPAEAIKQACAELRAQGNKTVSDLVPDLKSHVAQTFDRIRLNEMSFIGVVAEEPGVCYVALMQKFRTEVGTDKTQVVVYAIAIAKDKYVLVYRFALYLNSDSVSELLAKLKVNITALLAANQN